MHAYECAYMCACAACVCEHCGRNTIISVLSHHHPVHYSDCEMFPHQLGRQTAAFYQWLCRLVLWTILGCSVSAPVIVRCILTSLGDRPLIVPFYQWLCRRDLIDNTWLLCQCSCECQLARLGGLTRLQEFISARPSPCTAMTNTSHCSFNIAL